MKSKLLGVAFEAFHYLAPTHPFTFFSNHMPSPSPSRELHTAPWIRPACSCLHVFARAVSSAQSTTTDTTSQWRQSCFQTCWISPSTSEMLPNSLGKERIFAASGFATNHTIKEHQMEILRVRALSGSTKHCEKHTHKTPRADYWCGSENVA